MNVCITLPLLLPDKCFTHSKTNIIYGIIMRHLLQTATQTTAIVLAWTILTACQGERAQKPRPRGPVQVEVMEIATTKVKLATELPGRTTAYKTAEVRPQVNGIIQKRAFVEGSNVTAGQLLYQIDPAIYQAQYDSARATLEKAKAMEQSARLKADKYRTLVKTNAVSEIDQIEMDAVWKQRVADIAAAEAALNSARINLDYTSITAPISGIIGKSLITEGALVTAQQRVALARIQQIDPIYVDVTQSSTELYRLKKEFTGKNGAETEPVKTEVSILLEDGSEYEHTGTLEFSDVTVDPSTGAVTLRSIIANPDRKLLPGMFVRAKLSNGERDGIVIPASAITRTPKGHPMVMLVNGESKVEARPVKTGQNVASGVVIRAGLQPGDKLITAGLQKIRPGVQVAIAPKTEQKASAKQGE